MVVPCAYNILDRSAVSSINGKQDDKRFKPNHDMCLPFKKNIKTLCKELVKQDNKENQVIEQMGNWLDQL
jgi:hypothetical protein